MRISMLDYLLSISGEEIYYIPNPGNAGDSVIAASTFLLFDKVGINYLVKNRDSFDFSGKIVVYGGGGNLGREGAFSYKFIKKWCGITKRLIVLPHTIKDVSTLLGEAGSNVDIVCRELISYDYVKKNAGQANVYLADDMAFFLDVDKLLSFQLSPIKIIQMYINSILSKFYDIEAQPAALRQLVNFPQALNLLGKRKGGVRQGEKTLNAYRTDAEKTSIELPDDNIDISEAMALGVESKFQAMLCAALFAKFINTYDVVSTNRLHVGILSGLLGKKVYFYNNSYYKCRAVYDMSIKGKYKNVIWAS